MKKTILYVGWVGFGNYGDDLCRDLFSQRMTGATNKQGVELEVKSMFPRADFDERDLLRMKVDLVVLGAGSLFEPIYLRPLVLAQQKSIATAIWGSGIDVLSETATPLDISPDTAYMMRQVVNNCHLVGVRGPRTFDILRGIGCYHPDLHISGDPGLLWNPEDESGYQDDKPSEPPTIGVNWGSALNKVFGGNEQLAQKQLAEALKILCKEYKVIIYPVWDKDIPHCQRLAEQIGPSPHLVCLTRLPTVQELKKLYSQCLFTINLKLHANVFSAATNCPFIPLAYRSKTLDFAESMDYADLAIPLSAPDLTTAVMEMTKRLESDMTIYQERLDAKLVELRNNLISLENDMLKSLEIPVS